MNVTNEIQRIEKMAGAILRGEKSFNGIKLPKGQRCGTEYQKKTYAMIKANELLNN